ncbi:hypothetical protein ALI144C_02525 [Actinosynnema sp. ALI-1.44]|uniref:hypothetical protein n=1 Tax=Actinosynnema sp. ALI-1.44 TaxID=1933779 RepID=UPI00097C4DE9|nr:hypothetical protein [Actinosynnema sp. ALI-1.44]ONI90577.1 hypothetical protein ALI144C_02525 [Actinosynnema sp. ALI-1.44]
MAHLKLTSSGPFEDIAEAHQSCVATITRAAEQGLFTEAEAGLLIDRVRALSTRMTDRAKPSGPAHAG